jgi:hypothetical protein
MGIFSKLKEDFNRGGVKMQVQVPSSVPINQAIPVTITITSEEAKTITDVTAELQAQTCEQSIGIGAMGNGMGGVGVQEEQSNYQTVSQVEDRESFSVLPGETKTITLQLFLNDNNAAGMSTVSEALGGVMRTLSNLDGIHYLYRVNAFAQVEGIDFKPSDKQPIELLPATEATQPAAFTGPAVAEDSPVTSPHSEVHWKNPEGDPQPPQNDGQSESPLE